MSSSTIRRTLREFEDREWIRKDGYRYEATPLGAFVAAAMRDLLAHVETERQVPDVRRWLPGEADGFSLSLCTDAEVTVADADDPARPVNRFTALLAETDTLRMAGVDDAAVRENDTYEFVSDQAASACQTYGVKSLSLGARTR